LPYSPFPIPGDQRSFHSHDLIVSGDYAIKTGAYEMTVQPKKGKAMHDVGKYVSVWKKQPDGSWKMVRDVFNSDLPGM
jgi:ketosteroid isomerase-like protein